MLFIQALKQKDKVLKTSPRLLKSACRVTAPIGPTTPNNNGLIKLAAAHKSKAPNAIRPRRSMSSGRLLLQQSVHQQLHERLINWAETPDRASTSIYNKEGCERPIGPATKVTCVSWAANRA